MNPSNPQTWADWAALVTNLPIIIPFMLIVAGAVWWFRGTLYQSTIEGLKSQNAALEERLRLAQDKEKDVSAKLTVVTSEIGNLQAKVVSSPTTIPSIVQATSTTVSAVTELRTANNDLAAALRLDPRAFGEG